MKAFHFLGISEQIFHMGSFVEVGSIFGWNEAAPSIYRVRCQHIMHLLGLSRVFPGHRFGRSEISKSKLQKLLQMQKMQKMQNM